MVVMIMAMMIIQYYGSLSVQTIHAIYGIINPPALAADS